MIEGGLFVTGTDTEVGKTWVSCAILAALDRAGLSVFGLKPVAAGAQWLQEAWRNEDAVALMQHSNQALDYDTVNPCLLHTAVAPHVAAQWENKPLLLSPLVQHCREQLQTRSGFVLVEGAGGWRVPLNARENLADLAVALGLPVLMVVPIRLGCLNHALLTAEAIRRDGLVLAGWVANRVRADYAPTQALLETLEQQLSAPCLGRLPWVDTPAVNISPYASAAALASSFELPALLNAFGPMRKQS